MTRLFVDLSFVTGDVDRLPAFITGGQVLAPTSDRSRDAPLASVHRSASCSRRGKVTPATSTCAATAISTSNRPKNTTILATLVFSPAAQTPPTPRGPMFVKAP